MGARKGTRGTSRGTGETERRFRITTSGDYQAPPTPPGRSSRASRPATALRTARSVGRPPAGRPPAIGDRPKHDWNRASYRGNAPPGRHRTPGGTGPAAPPGASRCLGTAEQPQTRDPRLRRAPARPGPREPSTASAPPTPDPRDWPGPPARLGEAPAEPAIGGRRSSPRPAGTRSGGRPGSRRTTVEPEFSEKDADPGLRQHRGGGGGARRYPLATDLTAWLDPPAWSGPRTGPARAILHRRVAGNRRRRD